MAEDDVDFRQLLCKENSMELGKENLPPQASGELETACKAEEPESYCVGAEEGGVVVGGGAGGGRWDKSLGVLCQKFIMLFLVTPVSFASGSD